MGEALVSVIVPVYNVEKYLDKTITSIISQTYKHTEILLINDGSTDSSLEICMKYAKLDERISVYDKPNGGVSDARNYGLDRAKGQYILFVDSDDYIHSKMIEILLEGINSCNVDIMVCKYKSIWNGETIEESKDIYFDENNVEKYTNRQAMDILLTGNKNALMTIVMNKLYKANLWEGIRFPFGKIHEDDFVAHRILDKTENIGIIDAPLYFYVRNSESIIGKSICKESFNKVEAYKERTDYYIQNHYNSRKSICGYMYLIETLLYRYRKTYGKDDFWYEKRRLLWSEYKQYRKYTRIGDYTISWLKVKFPKIVKIIRRKSFSYRE